jgi:FHA domain
LSRKLIVNDGRRERELLLVGKIVVGRDPLCDISDADALLSRRHAEFVAGDDGVVVRDLGSRNGIFVNGAKIAEGALRSGDVIQVGHLQLRFVEDGAPLAAAPEMSDGDATAVIHAPSRPTPAPAPPGSVVQPPPAAVQPEEDESDQTSLVPPPGLSQIVRPGTGSRPPFEPRPSPSASHPGIAPDENDQTRVIAAPELRAAIHMAMAHPAPSPAQAAAQAFASGVSGTGAAAVVSPSESGVSARPESATAGPSRSGVTPPPAVSASSAASIPAPAPAAPPPPRAATSQVAVSPAPAAAASVPPSPATTAAPPPTSSIAAPTPEPSASQGVVPAGSPVQAAGVRGPWTTFVQTRVGAVAGIVVISALLFPSLGLGSLESAALAIAVAGASAFVVSAMIAERANDAARALKHDLELALEGKLDAIHDPMETAPSRDLADALTGLVARVRAAETGRR